MRIYLRTCTFNWEQLSYIQKNIITFSKCALMHFYVRRVHHKAVEEEQIRVTWHIHTRDMTWRIHTFDTTYFYVRRVHNKAVEEEQIFALVDKLR